MDWIKKNKLATALLLLLAFLLIKSFLPTWGPGPVLFEGALPSSKIASEELSIANLGAPVDRGLIPPRQEVTPVETEDRLVVEESNLSLVVDDTRAVADKVAARAKEAGGFMVNVSLTHPEEAPFATVVVRVPSEKLQETLDYYRGLAVKVSSENIRGTDVTAEYTDIEARLATLEKTKAKFESIMDQATQVQDILQVQRELISLQNQIDRLKGQREYLKKTAELAKITVYLSSDELALPYAPAKPFRPSAIFKLAVRSLVATLRGVVKAVIWIGVYGVVWGPVLLIIFFVRKKKRKEF